jgi:hypothetical protein
MSRDPHDHLVFKFWFISFDAKGNFAIAGAIILSVLLLCAWLVGQV